MASTTSEAEQQDLLQNFTSPGHQATIGDEEAVSASGGSTDTTIWISDDDSSDTEDEDDIDGYDLGNSRSCCTTPTTTSVVDQVDGMGVKHGVAESDAAVRRGTTPVLSPAPVEGVRISSHESQMGFSIDAESNQQALRSTTCTPTGDTRTGADAGSDASSIGPEGQPCLDASDGGLDIEATGATSKPDAMIDALSDEESCHGSQNAPAALSMPTYSSIAATPEVTAQTPPHDSEVCPSAERDDATPGARNSSPAARLSPESRKGRELNHGSCSPSDTKSESSGAKPRSLPGARVSPPSHGVLSRHRSRRPSPHTHTTVQEKDSDVDTEGSDSEDGLDVPECICDEEYCPSPPGLQGYDSGDNSEGEEQHCRKRRRVSRSLHASTRSAPASARSSRQRRLTRRTTHSPEERRTSVCYTESPTPSQATSVPSEARALLAKFEEWPLQDVLLKRITEGGRTTFQLQFEWTPDPRQHDRSVSHSEGRGSPKPPLSRTRSSGGKWTTEEENTVRTMRQAGRSWAEIHCALPHRSQGTIQVRYSTKLKYLPSSE